MPEGFTIARLDRSIAAQIEAGAGIDPWFLRIAGGPESYLAQDFGYCVLWEGRIVSLCASCGTGGGEVEMEVATAREFRGRGLATVACKAFLEQCLASGLTPGYTCAANNPASAAVAHKLGFLKTADVACYPLHASFTLSDGLWGAPAS